MRLIILGGPGAGKSTQGQRLCQDLGLIGLSTGDMMREAIASHTPLGQQVKSYVEAGDLVPDELMIELMRHRLLQPDMAQGWVLDGYPRTAFQAEELDFLLDELGQRLNWAIWLDVSEDLLIQRSLERSRLDDQLEVVKRRVQVLYERTIPMLDYYEQRQRLLRIKGEQSVEQVQQEIRSLLQG